ncbi:SdpI family protein [uncultured Gulosibacter sp.]|uniref:SdpI family protein n=1 Tax=uncultured Gulosibacter sp. TaxID=1339167 RepID=UPI00288A058B|nr:SdpI family protein [uncultured Gulosibacter sp.]
MLQPPGLTMSLLLAAIIVVGNALTLIAVRGSATGRFGPYSGLIGVRTAAARSSDAAWQAAHRAAWPWALGCNGVALVAAALGGALGNTVMPFLACMGISVAAMLVGAIAQLIVGHRAAQRELGER